MEPRSSHQPGQRPGQTGGRHHKDLGSCRCATSITLVIGYFFGLTVIRLDKARQTSDDRWHSAEAATDAKPGASGVADTALTALTAASSANNTVEECEIAGLMACE